MIVGRKYCRTECVRLQISFTTVLLLTVKTLSAILLCSSRMQPRNDLGAEAAFDGTKLKIGVMASAVPVSLCGRPAEGL